MSKGEVMDAELKAIFERGRQAIQARADLDIADFDFETRLRAAVCEVHAATAEEVEAQVPGLIAALRASLAERAAE